MQRRVRPLPSFLRFEAPALALEGEGSVREVCKSTGGEPHVWLLAGAIHQTGMQAVGQPQAPSAASSMTLSVTEAVSLPPSGLL